MQVEQNLVSHNEQLKRKALVGAAVEPREKGGYEVTLSLSDELDDLMNLLHNFGVSAVTELKPEQTGAFATALRGLGAKI